MNNAQPRPVPGGFWIGTAVGLLLLAGVQPALAVVAESIAAGTGKTFAVTTTGGVKGWGVDRNGISASGAIRASRTSPIP